MAPKKSSQATLLVQPANQPIVLAGAPDELAGQLLLRNPGEERLIVRDLRLRRVAAGLGRHEAAPFTLGPVVLEPGQQQHMQINLSLDRHTPPGEYTAELEAGDETRPVILHVVESVDLDIEPDTLVLDSPPGETIRKQVAFSNLGNVPLTIGDFGEVLLDDDLHYQRVLRYFLEAIDNEQHSLDEFLTELIRQSRRVIDQAGSLWVSCPGGPFLLNPGETRLIELEITLPSDLAAHQRYQGRAAVYTRDLDFVVVPAPALSKAS